jgi:hypothetical protein
MRSSRVVRNLPGLAALLAAFVLALPGVKAVRAADTAGSASLADGPTCHDTSTAGESTQIPALAEEIRRQIAASAAASGGQTPILLNNRGYNYGPGNSLERTALDLERIRAAEQ